MDKVKDYAARLSLYKKELPRRGFVLLFAGYLPFLLALTGIAYLIDVFTPPFSKMALVLALFLGITVFFTGSFVYMALRGLPAKIGLLCPHCHKFSVLDADPQVFRETGCCPKCGKKIVDLA